MLTSGLIAFGYAGTAVLLYQLFHHSPVGGLVWKFLVGSVAGIPSVNVHNPYEKWLSRASEEWGRPWQERWWSQTNASGLSILWPVMIPLAVVTWIHWGAAHVIWRLGAKPEELDRYQAYRSLFMLKYSPSSESRKREYEAERRYAANQREQRRLALLEEARKADEEADAFVQQCAADISGELTKDEESVLQTLLQK